MTTAAKTLVEAKWPLSKTQEEVARMLSTTWFTAYGTLSKLGEKAITEFETAMRDSKVQYYKSLGIKTPFDLVKAIAEHDANVFGSKVEIVGDEKVASLTYVSCGMWNAMQKYGKLDAEQQQKMGACFQSSMEHLASEFGFKSEVKFEGQIATITFNK